MELIKLNHYLLVFKQLYHLKKKRKKYYFIKLFYNSSSLPINIKQKKHFFPSDFFEPIYSSKNQKQIKLINYNNKNNSKSTYVNLEIEEEEDKELLDLIDGKCKEKIFNYIIFSL